MNKTIIKSSLLIFSLFFILFGSTIKLKANSSVNFTDNEILISHVEFLVKNFENKGDKKYDYLGNFLSIFLNSALKKVPFFTITEKQKDQLISNISLQYYLSGFTGNYLLDRPVVYVKPKLEVEVSRNQNSVYPFSITFSGSYKVENDTINMVIYRSSNLVKLEDKPYSIETDADDLLKSPELYFLHYVKSILNYRVFLTSINANPDDSIIAVDDRVYGVGKVQNILLTAGIHRVHVYRDGFQDYDDIITVLKDGFQKDVFLKSMNYERYIKIKSNPVGAKVYLNENFMGNTPLLLKVGADTDVITLTKQGYLNSVIYPYQYRSKKELIVKLNHISKLEETRELAEVSKKNSKLLYYSGIGFLAATIILAAETTVYKQKAELYKGASPQKYEDAIDKKNIYGALAIASSFSSGVVFTFSFIDILKYFKIYETGD